MVSIRAARVLTAAGFTGPAEVQVEAGRVVAVAPLRGPAPDRLLAPGFIDLQVNGIGAVDVATAAGGDWGHLDDDLLAEGVTAWCPTLTSRPLADYPPALARIAAAAADRTGDPHRDPVPVPAIVGVHLEGPFLTRPGAHPPGALVPADPAWIRGLHPLVRVVTIAPDAPGARAAIEAAVERDIVVALGHSDADLPTTTAAVGAGARLVTHVFNAMGPIHHRAPGLAGAALTDDRLTVTVIADGVHVHPAMVRLAFRAKPPGRVVLVTDRVAGATVAADGTLRGSEITMAGAVAVAVVRAGVDLADALVAASTTPAAVLGLADRGRIEVGARADLVALDGDLGVAGTWVAGDQVH